MKRKIDQDEEIGRQAVHMAEATLAVVKILAPLSQAARERALNFVLAKLAEDRATEDHARHLAAHVELAATIPAEPEPEPAPKQKKRKISAAGLASIRAGVRKRTAAQRKRKAKR